MHRRALRAQYLINLGQAHAVVADDIEPRRLFANTPGKALGDTDRPVDAIGGGLAFLVASSASELANDVVLPKTESSEYVGWLAGLR